MSEIVYLSPSTNQSKKWMVIVGNKTIHFGAFGMSDYTKHKDRDRMELYTLRHKKRENWTKSGIKTAGFWSKWLLWNKPTMKDSIADVQKRFNIRIKKSRKKPIRGYTPIKRRSPRRSPKN